MLPDSIPAVTIVRIHILHLKTRVRVYHIYGLAYPGEENHPVIPPPRLAVEMAAEEA